MYRRPSSARPSTRPLNLARRRQRPRLLAILLAFVACLGARTASADAVALTGRVTDAHGSVVDGADVRVRPDDGTLSPPTVSNPSGTFIVAELPAGDYVVDI